MPLEFRSLQWRQNFANRAYGRASEPGFSGAFAFVRAMISALAPCRLRHASFPYRRITKSLASLPLFQEAFLLWSEMLASSSQIFLNQSLRPPVRLHFMFKSDGHRTLSRFSSSWLNEQVCLYFFLSWGCAISTYVILIDLKCRTGWMFGAFHCQTLISRAQDVYLSEPYTPRKMGPSKTHHASSIRLLRT
jgi:hypothetical protein